MGVGEEGGRSRRATRRRSREGPAVQDARSPPPGNQRGRKGVGVRTRVFDYLTVLRRVISTVRLTRRRTPALLGPAQTRGSKGGRTSKLSRCVSACQFSPPSCCPCE